MTPTRPRPTAWLLFTTDTTATGETITERYAVRWSIEPSNANGKQMGVGQARNRLPKAVERTVPFGMIIQSIITTWYALYGHDPADVTDRAAAQPWYQTKTEPSGLPSPRAVAPACLGTDRSRAVSPALFAPQSIGPSSPGRPHRDGTTPSQHPPGAIPPLFRSDHDPFSGVQAAVQDQPDSLGPLLNP